MGTAFVMRQELNLHLGVGGEILIRPGRRIDLVEPPVLVTAVILIAFFLVLFLLL